MVDVIHNTWHSILIHAPHSSLKQCVTGIQPRITLLLARCVGKYERVVLCGKSSLSISAKNHSRKQRCDIVRTSAIVLVTTKAVKMGAMFRNNIKLLLFGICLLTDTCLFTFPTVMGIEGKVFCVIYMKLLWLNLSSLVHFILISLPSLTSKCTGNRFGVLQGLNLTTFVNIHYPNSQVEKNTLRSRRNKSLCDINQFQCHFLALGQDGAEMHSIHKLWCNVRVVYDESHFRGHSLESQTEMR